MLNLKLVLGVNGLEDIAIIIIILIPGCQQPFFWSNWLDNRLLVTTGCEQPLPKIICVICVAEIIQPQFYDIFL